MKFIANGFKSIAKGAYVGYRYVETMGDAANVFGDRLARRYGKNHLAIVQLSTWTSDSAMYQITVVAPSGRIEAQEWIHVSLG